MPVGTGNAVFGDRWPRQWLDRVAGRWTDPQELFEAVKTAQSAHHIGSIVGQQEAEKLLRRCKTDADRGSALASIRVI